MVSGNILASAHGGVGYLQPRGRATRSRKERKDPGNEIGRRVSSSSTRFEFKSIHQYWINLVCQTQISNGVDRLDPTH